ncbi:hypothetical protein G5714_024653 [Onychostoma macrolepis]|uniref:Uncharacterized protein n=1 Tax=Onychostoma macrolepis TaxID=369639 RepID=A0A7J6BIC0_9TELE|nr:hypothetical protein G5714_024653 [Onychostoma macrolepis]
MNATPQASYPCGNFSDTSCLKPKSQKDREAPLSRTPALPFDRCTAQSNSPPATVPGQVAPGTTWAPGLTQKREPAGARLPASPGAARGRRPGTPPGGGESTRRRSAGRSWGDPRRARRRPESPPARGAPPPARPALAPRTPRHTPARRHPAPPGRAASREGPPTRTGGGNAGRGAEGPGAARRRRNGRGARAAAPQPRLGPSPPHLSPTDPALRANPYPEVTDLTCRLPLRCLDLTRQRLFTLETCCGYGYGPARDLHLLPRIFKGRRELTGRRRNRGAFQGVGPSLGTNPFQGARPFTKKRELFPGPPPASPGSFALPHWAPRGACLRHSGFWDLNQTPFRSAGGDGGHRPSLPNGVRPSLRTD